MIHIRKAGLGMVKHSFFCVDAHTCGNPVRVVVGGAPQIVGDTASERRSDFIERYDWVRTGLMFEPRGHDMMSGSVLYPPTRPDCDLGLVYIETTGCLPMCGHGTIGTVTVVIEQGLVTPAEPGILRLDTPAGLVVARYRQVGDYVEAVRFTNVASYVHSRGIELDCPGLGALTLDVAYGGNFYAIIEPQENYPGLDDFPVSDILQYSPLIRRLLNQAGEYVHPEDPTIRGLSHVMWTAPPNHAKASARNAVFYGDHAIDRSPCGTGSSARMAQLVARGELAPGDDFIHESIIGSLFHCRVEETVRLGDYDAIIPSIEGWARITGLNTLFIDDRDPFAHGFQVS
jgi:4-hydroxyproline epimerase